MNKNAPYYLFSAGSNEYQLKLSTAASVELEKKLGTSLIEGLNKVSEINVLTLYLHAALQKYHPHTALETAYRIYDDYIEDGGTMSGFIDALMEVMVVSGFLEREAVERMAEIQKKYKEKQNAIQEKTLGK